LLEDDLGALSILLYIAYLQFDKVPSRLEFDELVAVAILADKHQAMKLVVLWFSA
jgi:hypothetical protein